MEKDKAVNNIPAPEANSRDWTRIATSKSFKDLIALKKTFIVPAFLIFLVHFLALAILLGYAPVLASTPVIGTLTVAYLFALSQFAVGWLIAGLYLIAASRFDALANDILKDIGSQEGGH